MNEPTKPSEVSHQVGLFDRFAGWASTMVSRAPFFAFCVLLVLAWVIEGIVKALSGGGLKTLLDGNYQLQINTTTTILTFLLVALLQNSQTRGEAAIQKKLNALADALADFIEHQAEREEGEACQHLANDAKELRAAVGLEHREGT